MEEIDLSDEAKPAIDRRTFLKTAAASAGVAGAASAITLAQAAEGAKGAGKKEAAGAKEGGEGGHGVQVIDRPGSDFMVDAIRTLGFEYIALNPGSSFRALHESLINYGGNKAPELITCMHEEASVAIAHGYAKAAGKPMAVAAHGTVGLQHATMALYNAWVDRVPIVVFAGNGLDIRSRRPGTEWNHSVPGRRLVMSSPLPANITMGTRSTHALYMAIVACCRPTVPCTATPMGLPAAFE